MALKSVWLFTFILYFENKNYIIDAILYEQGVCLSSKLMSQQLQKRSAGEGMTNFKSSECGKKWSNR